MVSPAEQHPSTMVEIRNEQGTTAKVNLDGAYLEALVSPDGSDILFPRQLTAAGKDRGGIPVCAPIFGPGDQVGLKQHGFARNLSWHEMDSSETSLTLRLENPSEQDATIPAEYAGAAMELTIILLDGAVLEGVEMRLTVTNNGTQPFLEASAFHPYFPVSSYASAEGYQIQFGQESPKHFTEEELADVQVGQTEFDVVHIEGENERWSITTQGLPRFVAWSDSSKDYFCIEPTAVGPLASISDLSERMLQPGETRAYAMTITKQAI